MDRRDPFPVALSSLRLEIRVYRVAHDGTQRILLTRRQLLCRIGPVSLSLWPPDLAGVLGGCMSLLVPLSRECARRPGYARYRRAYANHQCVGWSEEGDATKSKRRRGDQPL